MGPDSIYFLLRSSYLLLFDREGGKIQLDDGLLVQPS